MRFYTATHHRCPGCGELRRTWAAATFVRAVADKACAYHLCQTCAGTDPGPVYQQTDAFMAFRTPPGGGEDEARRVLNRAVNCFAWNAQVRDTKRWLAEHPTVGARLVNVGPPLQRGPVETYCILRVGEGTLLAPTGVLVQRSQDALDRVCIEKPEGLRTIVAYLWPEWLERWDAERPQTGTHASPRKHLRRSHWRRTPSGGRAFVRSAVVGEAGLAGRCRECAMRGRGGVCAQAGAYVSPGANTHGMCAWWTPTQSALDREVQGAKARPAPTKADEHQQESTANARR